MAYDRYDTRDYPRDERSRWPGEHDRDRERWEQGRGGREERGFFERAGDELASWFGDGEAERRRNEDRTRDERGHGDRYGREWNRAEDRWTPTDRFGVRRSSSSERDYRPIAGDYGRSDQFFAAGGRGRGERGMSDYRRPESEYGRDEYRRTSYPEAYSGSGYDPHYRSLRERHMSDLDRDYDEYRRENQARFEDEFGSWRERRRQKRGLLGQIREHMEVVGSDSQHVGTIDRAAGDRIILTKSDPESGGAHHSLSCSDIDRIEDDRVVLDLSAEQAKERWRDESRSRALFEREDQGEMGPRMLDRSFEGTYR